MKLNTLTTEVKVVLSSMVLLLVPMMIAVVSEFTNQDWYLISNYM